MSTKNETRYPPTAMPSLDPESHSRKAETDPLEAAQQAFSELNRLDRWPQIDFWVRIVLSSLVLMFSATIITWMSISLFEIPWLVAVVTGVIIWLCLVYSQCSYYSLRARGGDVNTTPIRVLRVFWIVILLFTGALWAVVSADKDIQGERIAQIEAAVQRFKESDEYTTAVEAAKRAQSAANTREELDKELAEARNSEANFKHNANSEVRQGGVLDLSTGQIQGTGRPGHGSKAQEYFAQATLANGKAIGLEQRIKALPEAAVLHSNVQTAQTRISNLEHGARAAAKGVYEGASGKMALYFKRLQGEHAVATWVALVGHMLICAIADLIDYVMLLTVSTGLARLQVQAIVRDRLFNASVIKIARQAASGRREQGDLLQPRVIRPVSASATACSVGTSGARQGGSVMNESASPAIECLLQDAYAVHARLLALRQRFQGFGFTEDQLPTDLQLQAFAILGDHGRPHLLAELEGCIDAFVAKRLLLQDEINIAGLPTPLLRFLSIPYPYLAVVEDLLARVLTAATAADTPDAGCAIVSAPVEVRLLAHGVASEVEIILRDVMRVAILPLVVADNRSSQLPVILDCGEGSSILKIPLLFPVDVENDRGELILILIDPQGALSRRRIPVRVLAANKALDSFLPRMPRFMRGART